MLIDLLAVLGNSFKPDWYTVLFGACNIRLEESTNDPFSSQCFAFSIAMELRSAYLDPFFLGVLRSCLNTSIFCLQDTPSWLCRPLLCIRQAFHRRLHLRVNQHQAET